MDPAHALDGPTKVILASLGRWGPVIVFALMFLDCLPFAAFVAPGVIVLVLAGYVAAGEGLLDGVGLFTAGCAGIFVCDTTMYLIGRSGYARSAFVKGFVDRRAKFKHEIERQRTAVLIFYQFPPYSRMFAPLILGALGASWARWLSLVSLSTLVFVTSFFALGWAAGAGRQAATSATNAASSVSTVFLLAFVAWLVALVVRLFRRRRAEGA